MVDRNRDMARSVDRWSRYSVGVNGIDHDSAQSPQSYYKKINIIIMTCLPRQVFWKPLTQILGIWLVVVGVGLHAQQST